MHYWNTVQDCTVAPSPIVPTYRPYLPLKRRNSTMPSPTSGPVGNVGSRAVRPEARSAGMAERSTRNESLSDLIAFLQTQNPPASMDSPTALRTVNSPRKAQPLAKEQLKPLHRRLLQFTQRQKKDSSVPTSKPDDQRRQIEALQREGYLVSGSKTVPSSRSTRSKASFDTFLSQSKKKDVEKIGQPWLAKETHKNGPELPADGKRRLASLDFGDFGSMVDMTVSLSNNYDDLSPPPYQPSVSNGSHSTQNSASQSTSALPLEKASMEARPSRSTDRPMSPPADSADGHSRRPSTSTGCSIGIDGRDGTSCQPVSRSASLRVSESSGSSAKSDSRADREVQKRTQVNGRCASNPTGSPPKPMKLFPDVAPPRGSSKAWRISAVPQYQKRPGKPAALSDAKSEVSEGVNSNDNENQHSGKSSPTETRDESRLSVSERNPDTAPPVPIQPSTAAEPGGAQNSTQSQDTSRVSPLTMCTLKAFPLPAPMKPLPSIPKGRGYSTPPEAQPQLTARTIRPGPKSSVKNHSQPPPIAEDPRESQGRPATALGYAGEHDAADDHESLQSRASLERPKSTEPEQYPPRRRASSFRTPRMHDLHESPGERNSEQPSEGLPIADSPVLGQKIPTKSHKKRAARKGLQINSHVNRRHLPFGLPSPPPTAALPSDPPVQPSAEAATVRGLDIAFQGGSSASVISRSNSSRSSLRHDSIPESHEPDRCESPLPSSDDEGFGPASATIRSRRTVEQQNLRGMPSRRGYEILRARPSQGRLRCSHSLRPETPQDQGGQGVYKPPSPQFEYSQSTYHSIDSQGSYHIHRGGSRAANFLEDRVANLERQNQILQAALLAALNAGVKTPLESLQDSAVSPTFPPAGLGAPYPSRYASRPDSWVSSARSSEYSGCETPSSYRENRAKVRQLENMIEDIQSGWLSDKSSASGSRITHKY